MEQAKNRVTFGEPIANRQAIQWMIADSAVEIEALRWLVLTAAWQVDHGIDSRQSQSMAKLYGGVKANADRRPGAADPRRDGLHP